MKTYSATFPGNVRTGFVPSTCKAYCRDGRDLSISWQLASLPIETKEIHYLEWYEEVKSDAADELSSHIRCCSRCRGAASALSRREKFAKFLSRLL